MGKVIFLLQYVNFIYFFLFCLEDFIVCPYDRSHRMLEGRLQRHIFRCHREAWERERQLREAALPKASPPIPSQPSKWFNSEPPKVTSLENWDDDASGTYVPSLKDDLMLDKTSINFYNAVFGKNKQK